MYCLLGVVVVPGPLGGVAAAAAEGEASLLRPPLKGDWGLLTLLLPPLPVPLPRPFLYRSNSSVKD